MQADKELIERMEQLIQEHEVIVLEHQESINAYKAAIANLQGIKARAEKRIEVAKPIKNGPIKTAPTRKISISKKSKTSNSSRSLLFNTAIKVIDNNAALTNADFIRTVYNKETNQNISISNFSPRISLLKKEGKLGMYVNEGAGIKNKYLYGLPEWFEDLDNGVLKEEHLDKIKAGVQIQLY